MKQQLLSHFSFRQWVSWLTLACLFLFYQQGQAIWMLIEKNWQALHFKYTLDYGEGPLLDQAVRLTRLENIYRPEVSTPPFTISNYPPLFPLIQAPFVKIFGPALWYGRLISCVSILLAALMIGLTIHALTQDRLASLIGGLSFLTIPYIFYWSAFNRVDSLALLFCCAALYVIARKPDIRSQRILAAVLLAASIFTKQSFGLAAPLAGFIWLIREPPRRRAIELALWTGGIGLVALIVLQIASQGGFFFNIVTANVNPFIWATVKRYATEIYRNMPFLVIGSLFFLVAGWRQRERSWWLLAPFLITATISAVTIGKDGSNVNYLYELCAAISLVVGALIAWAGKQEGWLRITLILILAVQTGSLTDWSRRDFNRWTMERILQSPDLSRLMQVIQRADSGPILADEHMALVSLSGRMLPYQPFEFKMLAQAHLWDQQPFLESIKRKEYPLILLYDPPDWDSRHARWTQEMLTVIEDYYQRGPQLADVSVYRPK